MKANAPGTPTIEQFLEGKSAHTLALYHHLIHTFQQLAPVTLHPAKTMIGIGNRERRIAWITAPGKNFVHVVFPFTQRYDDNLCFIKIARVPGTAQYNHHFRMHTPEDVNEEVQRHMKRALEGQRGPMGF